MTISRTRVIAILFGAAATTWGAGAAFAEDSGQCAGLPSQGALKNALTLARNQANGGFNLDMWATVVNRDGLVCAVAYRFRSRAAMAREPRHLGSEGEYRQCIQPARPRTIHGQLVLGSPAGRQPVRLAAQQSCEHRGGLPWSGNELWHRQ